MNRRVAIPALALLLIALQTSASDRDNRAQRSAYAAIALSAAKSDVRIIGLGDESASERVIVEFVTPPLAAMAPTARDATTHTALLTRFRNDLAAIDASASDTKSPASIVEHGYSIVYSGAAVTASGRTVAALRQLPYVRRVVPDAEVRASVEPGVGTVGADRVWSAFGTRGSGVTVAILDSGIDYSHPALGGGIGPEFRIASGHDFVNDDDDPMDDNGHGTHVAGIVAARSAEIDGVAPDATLLAFKVLDSALVGLESDILAAIERCADPNGDGSFSDRVDVVNMSLGADGAPDDPQSRAVDTATELGIVFVVAAGNQGEWRSVRSPGTAASAITVGASDGAIAVAGFSSRGPVPPFYSIKPEVVAPGVSVRSTWPGGGTETLSGTSMSAPHVAGVAALLRAIHPTWSPAEIKGAIVSTAQPLDESVMSGGAGVPDAERAAATRTLVVPAMLDFGVVDTSVQRWSSHRAVVVRNVSDESRSYSVRATGARAGLTLSFNVISFTLQAGESLDLEVIARADNGRLPYPDDGSLAFGGGIVIDSAGQTSVVPWAIVKGHAFRVEWSGNENVQALIAPVGGRTEYLSGSNGRQFDALLSPGNYNLSLVALPTDGAPAAFVAVENLIVDSDRVITSSRESAPYTLSFSANDENRRPFMSGLASPAGCSRERAIVLPGADAPVIEIVNGESPDLRTSALTGQYSILGAELCVDESLNRIYSMSYQPIRGVSSSVARSAGGDDLLAQPVDLRVPLGGVNGASLRLDSLFRLNGLPLPVGMTRTMPWSEERWNGVLYLGSSLDPGLEFPVRMSAVASTGNASESVVSKLIHRIGDAVRSFDSASPSPTTYEARPGETLVLGRGSVIPSVSVNAGERSSASVEFLGHLDESVSSASASISLFTRSGTLLGSGRSSVEIPDLAAKPTIVAQTSSQEIDGLQALARASIAVGSTTDDPIPPTLTSMILVDASGARIVERVTRGSVPRARFSAFDAGDAAPRTRVRFRRNGTVPWTEVPVVVVGHDPASEQAGLPSRGTIYEASLGQLALTEGIWDLEILVEDRAGNTTITELIPAISIVEGRKRPARP
ncbi:MAG: S8 family serine peptidase [Acidobacteria bacterium]|nr:S8 family serine peptidase [Acidobacteriota bacterium]